MSPLLRHDSEILKCLLQESLFYLFKAADRVLRDVLSHLNRRFGTTTCMEKCHFPLGVARLLRTSALFYIVEKIMKAKLDYFPGSRVSMIETRESIFPYIVHFKDIVVFCRTHLLAWP